MLNSIVKSTGASLSLTLLLVLGACSLAKADVSTDSGMKATYASVGAKLTTTMLECPQRIWPAYNWNSMNILMLAENEPSFLWRGETGTIEPLDESQIPMEARQGSFAFLKWNGKDAISFYSLKSEPYWRNVSTMLGFIVHEGFHRLGQRGWPPAKAERGTAYPIQSTPRIYRRMIYDRMKSYFNSNGQNKTNLAHAAFWFRRWKTEFPSEALATTDGYEGTARYVETMAQVLGNLGCDATDDAVLSALQKFVAEQMGFSVSGETLQLDSEGYDLGSLAGFILRFIEKDTTWFERMAKGETPLDVLLKNVPIETEEIAPNLESQFAATAQATNKSTGGWLDEDIKTFHATDRIKVVFPSSSMKASYSPRGFFRPLELPGVTLIPLGQPRELLRSKLGDDRTSQQSHLLHDGSTLRRSARCTGSSTKHFLWRWSFAGVRRKPQWKNPRRNEDRC